MIEVLVITISNPLLIGVYENKKLIHEYKLDGKTSDLLPTLFEELLTKFDIKKIIYEQPFQVYGKMFNLSTLNFFY